MTKAHKREARGLIRKWDKTSETSKNYTILTRYIRQKLTFVNAGAEVIAQ